MIDGMTPIIFRLNSPRILRVLDMIPFKLEVLRLLNFEHWLFSDDRLI